MIHFLDWRNRLTDDLNNMARREEDIEKEIRRIEGQLLVAKQICRENVRVFISYFHILVFP